MVLIGPDKNQLECAVLITCRVEGKTDKEKTEVKSARCRSKEHKEASEGMFYVQPIVTRSIFCYKENFVLRYCV